MRKWIVALVVLFGASGQVFAQQTKPASKAVVLKAARMYDGKSEAVVKPGVVVVSGGKIAAAGPNVTIPNCAKP